MSLYNMLFGMNPNSDLILALLGLKKNDIERYRNCGIDFENQQIYIYTRTGGANREEYLNELLVNNPNYKYDEDDDFDSTYATYYFNFPKDLKEEIMCLKDICQFGIPAKLIQYVVGILNREPNESDKYTAIYESQYKLVDDLKKTMDAIVWNGHTVVPLSDSGMQRLLEAAEKNDGKFIAYWGIKPYQIEVKTNTSRWSFDVKRPDLEQDKSRVFIDQPKNWQVDEEWWNRWQQKFENKYPKAIQEIRESLK